MKTSGEKQHRTNDNLRQTETTEIIGPCIHQWNAKDAGKEKQEVAQEKMDSQTSGRIRTKYHMIKDMAENRSL